MTTGKDEEMPQDQTTDSAAVQKKRSDAGRMSKPPGSRKSSIAQIEQRVTTVLELLMRGASRRQVIQYAATNWQVSQRMADEYIARANQRVFEELEPDREKAIAHAINRLKKMFAKNYDNDQRLTLEIAKEIHRIQGVYPAEKSDLRIQASVLEEMSEEQLAKVIRDAEIAEAEIKRISSADGK